MTVISGVNHSGKRFDFTLLFLIGANSFKCFNIIDDQVLKSSSMLGSIEFFQETMYYLSD